MVTDCIFCKIIAGEIPAEIVYQDEDCFAFKDVAPQAPVHVLIVPKQHIASLNEAEKDHKAVLGHIMLEAGAIAKKLGIAKDGYRIVVNTNENGGQTVFHLHVHLLGGRQFIFPPG